MKVLVCGGREFTDRSMLTDCLDRLASVVNVEVVIEGEQRGADRLAREWADARGIDVDPYEAEWTRLGRSAGIIRNRAILERGKPDLVVAFPTPESVGTWHMVRIARRAGVPAFVMPEDMAVVDALGEGVFV